LAAFFLLALLVALVLFLAYRQQTSAQQSLVAEVATLRQDLDRLSEISAAGDPLQDKLLELTAFVGQMSASLERLDQKQGSDLEAALTEAVAVREEVEAKLGAEIQRLTAEQQRLVREIESVRETRRTAPPGSGQRGESEAPDREAGGAAETETPPAPLPPSGPGTGEAQPPNPTDAGTAGREYADAGASETNAARAADAAPETLAVGELTYGVQLIGFFSREELERFASREDLPARVYVSQDTYRGRPWFALLHSLHEAYAEAEAESARLSPDLRNLNPWIRPLSAGDVLDVLEKDNGR
jgi:DamX protein